MAITNQNQHFMGCGCGCGALGLLFANLLEQASKELLLRQQMASPTISTAMLGSHLSSSLEQLLGVSPQTETVTHQVHQVNKVEEADTIYHNGSILTMVRDEERVEALAVKDGKILCLGAKEFVLATQGPNTEMFDLGGTCLMPGFIDPHSHIFGQSLKFTGINLDPSPIGPIKSIIQKTESDHTESIQGVLRKYIKDHDKTLTENDWIVGFGYDDTAIEEMRHPLKEDLDAVSRDYPIMLVHISGHLVAVNQKLLDVIGINSSTPDPQGGKYQRVKGTANPAEGNYGEPNGVAEEVAAFYIEDQFPKPSNPQEAAQKVFTALETGCQEYAKVGITTAQEGFASGAAIGILTSMAQANKLPIDVVCYPAYKDTTERIFDQLVRNWSTYFGRLRLGGLKMTLDGSIQGYTAYLREPYHLPPGSQIESGDKDQSQEGQTPSATYQIISDKCQSDKSERMFVSPTTLSDQAPMIKSTIDSATEVDKNYRGALNMTLEEVTGWVKRCDQNNVPFIAHTNGDAATDVLIEAIKSIRNDQPRPDLRSVIIHAQTIREDQLDFVAEQGMIPSLFPTHIKYWGDRHRDIFLGPKRAQRICPAQSCIKRNLKFTLHHDAPVAGVGMLPLVSAAVNRITSQGHPLGLDQRITTFEALRAITADAAWQYFEEDRKGTLEPGKLADLVILSEDPLTVDTKSIDDIKVLSTIKEGETIYQLIEPY